MIHGNPKTAFAALASFTVFASGVQAANAAMVVQNESFLIGTQTTTSADFGGRIGSSGREYVPVLGFDTLGGTRELISAKAEITLSESNASLRVNTQQPNRDATVTADADFIFTAEIRNFDDSTAFGPIVLDMFSLSTSCMTPEQTCPQSAQSTFLAGSGGMAMGLSSDPALLDYITALGTESFFLYLRTSAEGIGTLNPENDGVRAEFRTNLRAVGDVVVTYEYRDVATVSEPASLALLGLGLAGLGLNRRRRLIRA